MPSSLANHILVILPCMWLKLKLCRRVKAVLPAYIKFGFIHALQVYQQVAFPLFSVYWVYTTIFRKLNERVIRHLFAKSTPDENWTYGRRKLFSYNIVVCRACAATHKNYWNCICRMHIQVKQCCYHGGANIHKSCFASLTSFEIDCV